MHATAAEQHVAHAVKATGTDLLNTLNFGDACDSTQRSHAALGKALLVVAPGNRIAGMAIYFFTYVAWVAKPGVCLEDLYVLPGYTRHGYARLLVQAVAKRAKVPNADRMEWLCFRGNHRALKFYASLGAKEMEDLTFLRLDKEALVDLADAELRQ